MSSRPTQHFPNLSQASTAERIDYLRAGAIFETSARRGLKDHLARLMRDPLDSDQKLIFLTGPPGMGFSCLLKEFVAEHPPYAEGRGAKTVVPVVNEQIHPSGNIEDYCDELRASLAIPGYVPSERRTSLRRTLTLLGHVETRLVILEDFHVTYSFAKHQQAAYQNYVHHLISKFDIRVVLTGNRSIWRWAMEDEQTLGRASHFEYRSWAPHDDDFIEFLDAFERWCPTQNHGTLSVDRKARTAIIRKTHGVCREVMRVLTALAIFAIKSGSERLDLETWLAYRDRDLP